jgi:hypothetical protein
MKGKIVVISAVILILNTTLFAQNQNDVFNNNTPISWLGLDFSEALLIGDTEKFKDDQTIKDFITSLNALMISEADKYNIAEVFQKTKVENAVEVTDEQNRSIKVESLRSSSLKSSHLSPEAIQKIVSQYNFKGKDGIGLMFNIDSFNKFTEQGSLWITFVNMRTKKVIMTELLLDKPRGFGIRNYWAGCIYAILKQVKKVEFESWKEKYYRAD